MCCTCLLPCTHVGCTGGRGCRLGPGPTVCRCVQSVQLLTCLFLLPLPHPRAVAGEAAGLALGLLYAGSGTDKAAELLAYAHETQVGMIVHNFSTQFGVLIAAWCACCSLACLLQHPRDAGG